MNFISIFSGSPFLSFTVSFSVQKENEDRARAGYLGLRRATVMMAAKVLLYPLPFFNLLSWGARVCLHVWLKLLKMGLKNMSQRNLRGGFSALQGFGKL